MFDVSTLLHTCWNVKTTDVARAGFVNGMIIFLKIVASPAPSTTAASISASGIPSTNCLTRNKPTGMAISGRICANHVLYAPIFTIIKYLGIETAVATNIRAIWLISHKAPLILNFFFEKT